MKSISKQSDKLKDHEIHIDFQWTSHIIYLHQVEVIL